MTPIDFEPFDADNHYYEALDAFTRHLDPKLGSRVIEWAQINGRSYHVIGGRVNRAVVNPTFDPVAKPGALFEHFRGLTSQPAAELLRDRDSIRPEYRDRDARLAVMDEQGIGQAWLFPTLGVMYEEPLRHDPEAVMHLVRAFNRWILDDWGFHYRGRLYAAPYISLADPQAAVAELEWAVDNGARIICMRPAAPTTRDGRFPPGDRYFDAFWARVDEIGITTVLHAGDSGTASNGYFDERADARDVYAPRPSVRMFAMERAITDFVASLIFDKLFTRFPGVRIASIENGSNYVPDLLRVLRFSGKKFHDHYGEDPVQTFLRHVWVNPFGEDDVGRLVELVGADRVLFGSDWPHIEGLRQPLDYLPEVEQFSPSDRRLIMRDNAAGLTELAA